MFHNPYIPILCSIICTKKRVVHYSGSEEISLRRQAEVLTIVFILLLLSTLIGMPVGAATNGPKNTKLLIHIFPNVDAELLAFETATGANAIDFIDSPLPKGKVGLWQTPAYSSYISLRDYSEIGHFKIDINNQRWPTGVEAPRILDPATGTYKHWFGTNEPWDSKATEFRKAIAYLSNKDSWIANILNGYGYRQDTDVPVPALAGYTDYADLRSKGLIYDYDPAKAAQVLDAAGFIQGSTSNPYYDPSTPGSAQYLRVDPRFGGDLQPLIFYIRIDDSLRRNVGRDLTAQIRKAGIQVDAFETDKTLCHNQVMVLYDYHLYTGGSDMIGLDFDVPDALHNLFHSSQYLGGSSSSYYGGVGWSPNYAGFVDSLYDTWAEQSKYGETFEDVLAGALKAQERAAELVRCIPAYARAAVKAFKKGWSGTVNLAGQGPDNRWSSLNSLNTVNTPLNPNDDEIDIGCKAWYGVVNPICPFWVPDAFLLSLMYDTLLCPNPYDLAMDYGCVADDWSFDSNSMSAVFHLRPGNSFHNGDPVTPEDVKFSLEFQRACGPGVARSYSELEPIVRVDTATDDPTLGPLDVKVYFAETSYWALHWAGHQLILNKNIWMVANLEYGWGYTRGLTDFTLFTNRWKVRDYKPWYSDVDKDGTKDFEEDGSGPWVFKYYTPIGHPIEAATSIALEAFADFIIPQTAISGFLDWSFQMIGDVNNDGVVDASDGQAIAKALGTDSSMLPWGSGWDQYNPVADINKGTWDMIAHRPLAQGDGYINYLDMGKWGLNFGKSRDN